MTWKPISKPLKLSEVPRAIPGPASRSFPYRPQGVVAYIARRDGFYYPSDEHSEGLSPEEKRYRGFAPKWRLRWVEDDSIASLLGEGRNFVVEVRRTRRNPWKKAAGPMLQNDLFAYLYENKDELWFTGNYATVVHIAKRDGVYFQGDEELEEDKFELGFAENVDPYWKVVWSPTRDIAGLLGEGGVFTVYVHEPTYAEAIRLTEGGFKRNPRKARSLRRVVIEEGWEEMEGSPVTFEGLKGYLAHHSEDPCTAREIAAIAQRKGVYNEGECRPEPDPYPTWRVRWVGDPSTIEGLLGEGRQYRLEMHRNNWFRVNIWSGR